MSNKVAGTVAEDQKINFSLIMRPALQNCTYGYVEYTYTHIRWICIRYRIKYQEILFILNKCTSLATPMPGILLSRHIIKSNERPHHTP